ncbi:MULTISPECIES: DUF2730 family protein [unclassified Yoonia]|uniref:DUF2730 family protein n=1 Tax=unclassified Yoonia TaxID=2629118 RepID=UPI002AFF26B2|nr:MULTISPECIES: DUF2730 family protein [unclassified Yoonia]
MDWIEALGVVQVVAAIVVAFGGIISAVGVYLNRKMTKFVQEVTKDNAAAQKTADDKLTLLIADLASTKTKVAASEDDLRETKHRLNNLETTIRSLPTRDDFHKFGIQLTELKGELRPVAAIMERMQELLLQRGKDKL